MLSRQVKLIKKDREYICWIPNEYAVLDKYLKIKIDGKWDDGWQVKELYSILKTEYVRDRSQDYKRTRKASDV